ncbi:hypothetical protein [Paenibacillus sp. DMB20]|nr:hypothetical protein [Paenibacillus sp. DMB20]KKO54760.1 hypothetical protein XI25_04525 [Paenibacillus sp. DMB20]
MYHLLVVKEEIDENQLCKMVEEISWYDPPLISNRRLKDKTTVQSNKLNALAEENIILKEQLLSIEQAKQKIENKLNEGLETIKSTMEKTGQLTQQKEELLREFRTMDQSYSDLKCKYQQQINSSKILEEELESLKASKYMRFKQFF